MERKLLAHSKNETIEWTDEHQQLLISWAEKASGYFWLHNKSISYYKRNNLYISIPASVFGYIAGTTTLLSNDLFRDSWGKSLIGICGIFAGILSNFQQMFTFKELSEQHRMASLRFISFFRDISSELTISPENRTNPIDYITLKRLELDKMLEQSPSIPETIIQEFNSKTKNKNGLHKPEICNILETILPYSNNKGQENEKHTLIDYNNIHNNTKNTDDIQIAIANSSHVGSEHYLYNKQTRVVINKDEEEEDKLEQENRENRLHKLNKKDRENNTIIEKEKNQVNEVIQEKRENEHNDNKIVNKDIIENKDIIVNGIKQDNDEQESIFSNSVLSDKRKMFDLENVKLNIINR